MWRDDVPTKDDESSPAFTINVQDGRLFTRKPTEPIDVSASKSTTSHANVDNNQGNLKFSVSTAKKVGLVKKFKLC